MKILITGANGFIGTHLIEAILARTSWQVRTLDLLDSNLAAFKQNERFSFTQGDLFKMDAWLDEQVAECDVVVPLAGIAKPAYYVKRPLWTFELDFEHNLKIVRMCVEHKKRLIFPSTSEVYGMSSDTVLTEDESPLVVGPIAKVRWIYSCSKQMIDRVIWAYGQERDLRFTLFRPFNWIGPRLDTFADARERTARSVTQILYDILTKGEVSLVDGGAQRRSFTWIGDAVDALLLLLENADHAADGQIFNIGNPDNNASIKELALAIRDALAEMESTPPALARKAADARFVSIPAATFYSSTYEDTQNRVPSVEKIENLMGWRPQTAFKQAVRLTLEAMRPQIEDLLRTP